MGHKTLISWCDDTSNWWRGCDKVSEGCRHCYITQAAPLRRAGQKHGDPRVYIGSGEKILRAAQRKPWVCKSCGHPSDGGTVYCKNCLCKPWQAHPFRRRRVFIESLGDWLDPVVPTFWLALLLDGVRESPDVNRILVTKRPELFEKRISAVRDITGLCPDLDRWLRRWLKGEAPKNVWIVGSIENQDHDHRLIELLKIPCSVRGVSFEPLLGPIDVFRRNPFWSTDRCPFDWFIIGGESGKDARQCKLEWIRSLAAQGKQAGVPVFVKQVGANLSDEDLDECAKATGRSMQHRKGGDPAEWPEDLRIQQFPNL